MLLRNGDRPLLLVRAKENELIVTSPRPPVPRPLLLPTIFQRTSPLRQQLRVQHANRRRHVPTIATPLPRLNARRFPLRLSPFKLRS
jgi:hypothetical protein